MDNEIVASLRQHRDALAQAVNAHDVEAIKTFIHPSYTAKSPHGMGLTWKYQDILDAAQISFTKTQNFQEAVESEDVEVTGDTTRLTTVRHDSYGLFWIFQKRGDTRQIETWQQFDGQWMITHEQVLDQNEHVSVRIP